MRPMAGTAALCPTRRSEIVKASIVPIAPAAASPISATAATSIAAGRRPGLRVLVRAARGRHLGLVGLAADHAFEQPHVPALEPRMRVDAHDARDAAAR